jgi:AbiV family abortive infection protein
VIFRSRICGTVQTSSTQLKSDYLDDCANYGHGRGVSGHSARADGEAAQTDGEVNDSHVWMRQRVRYFPMKDISEVWAKGVSDAALEAVARNALRHFIEADEHFKKQRFASAFASAIFSIEETGKLISLAVTGVRKQTHREKQLMFIALLKFVTSTNWWSHWRAMLKDGITADTVLSEQQLKDIADHPEMASYVEALKAGKLTDPKERFDAFIKAVTEKEKRDGTTDRWRPLFEGQLHKLRLQATYVDISDKGEPVSEPSTIDAGTAEFLCAGALGLLTVSLMLLKSRLTCVKDEFETLVTGEEVTGGSLVEKVAQPYVDALNKAKEKGRAKET